jgi:Uma2 family endonuclease
MSGFAEEPRATYSAAMGKAEFFAWLQMREGGRYELKDGAIVMHAGSRLQHARLSGRFLAAIARQLDLEEWFVVMADFAVTIGDDIRYPDVVAARADSDPAALSTDSPVFIIEVLSPSSTGRDMVEKLAEYTTLPSLEAYVVASQDEAIAWVWQRDADTRAFPAQPVEIAGFKGFIIIEALGVTLPLSEIYRGIANA